MAFGLIKSLTEVKTLIALLLPGVTALITFLQTGNLNVVIPGVVATLTMMFTIRRTIQLSASAGMTLGRAASPKLNVCRPKRNGKRQRVGLKATNFRLVMMWAMQG